MTEYPKQIIQINFFSLTDWKIDLFKALLAFLKLKLKQTKINLSEIPLVDLGVDSFKDKLFSSVIILISLNFNHVIESFLLYRPHHSLIQLALPTLIKLPSSVSERYRKKKTQYKNGKIRNKLSSFFCSLICFYPFLLLPPPSLLPLPPPSSLPPFPSLPPSPLLPSPPSPLLPSPLPLLPPSPLLPRAWGARGINVYLSLLLSTGSCNLKPGHARSCLTACYPCFPCKIWRKCFFILWNLDSFVVYIMILQKLFSQANIQQVQRFKE